MQLKNVALIKLQLVNVIALLPSSQIVCFLQERQLNQSFAKIFVCNCLRCI